MLEVPQEEGVDACVAHFKLLFNCYIEKRKYARLFSVLNETLNHHAENCPGRSIRFHALYIKASNTEGAEWIDPCIAIFGEQFHKCVELYKNYNLERILNIVFNEHSNIEKCRDHVQMVYTEGMKSMYLRTFIQ